MPTASKANSSLPLGPLEQKIMRIMWKNEATSVHAVLTELNASARQRKELAYTTVMTILNRLHQKKMVKRKKIGKQYVYSPVVTQETFIRRVIHKMITTFVDKFGEEAVAAFVLEANQLSAADKTQLAKQLKKTK